MLAMCYQHPSNQLSHLLQSFRRGFFQLIVQPYSFWFWFTCINVWCLHSVNHYSCNKYWGGGAIAQQHLTGPVLQPCHVSVVRQTVKWPFIWTDKRTLCLADRAASFLRFDSDSGSVSWSCCGAAHAGRWQTRGGAQMLWQHHLPAPPPAHCSFNRTPHFKDTKLDHLTWWVCWFVLRQTWFLSFMIGMRQTLCQNIPQDVHQPE